MADAPSDLDDSPVRDERLELIFACCHPRCRSGQVPLILRRSVG